MNIWSRVILAIPGRAAIPRRKGIQFCDMSNQLIPAMSRAKAESEVGDDIAYVGNPGIMDMNVGQV